MKACSDLLASTHFQKSSIIDKVSLLNEQSLIHLKNQCVLSATWFTYNIPDLKLVAGSFGLGASTIKHPTSPWFEYGDQQFVSVDQFLPLNKVSIDAHVWTEDQNGNVYDVLNQYMLSVAAFHKKRVGVKQPRLIKGISKASLSQSGFHYIPFKQDQQTLLNHAIRIFDMHANGSCTANHPLTSKDIEQELSRITPIGSNARTMLLSMYNQK